MLSRNPFLLILSAPSGTGKTTLCRALLRHDSSLGYSVSATTRPKHKKEVEGKDYLFVTADEFQDMIDAKKLLEWEEVYGYRYGTPRVGIEELLGKGLDVALDLDIKGALHVKSAYPHAVSVFLLPPDLEELKHRLTTRGREGSKAIKERLARAEEEIAQAEKFDYVVINDSLAESVRRLQAILTAERMRSQRIKRIELVEER